MAEPIGGCCYISLRLQMEMISLYGRKRCVFSFSLRSDDCGRITTARPDRIQTANCGTWAGPLARVKWPLNENGSHWMVTTRRNSLTFTVRWRSVRKIHLGRASAPQSSNYKRSGGAVVEHQSTPLAAQPQHEGK